jgi:hypothetical protein
MRLDLGNPVHKILGICETIALLRHGKVMGVKNSKLHDRLFLTQFAQKGFPSSH